MNHALLNDYVLGHGDTELQRLSQQSEFYQEFTEDLLNRAGLASGMRVLDVGCGAGDVSFLAAQFVGPAGQVIGMDRSATAIAFARRRARSSGTFNVTFIEGDLCAPELKDAFDAVIGRFVLMFLPNPATVLRHLQRHTRKGGIVAFQEMDILRSHTQPPDMMLWQKCSHWIETTFERAGVDIQMGRGLYTVFRQSGLPSPEMNLHARIGGAESTHPDYVAGVVTTLLPTLQRLGIASAAEVRIDTLAARLRAELDRNQGTSILPSIVGAWTTIS
jgi:ubiquinone/menaquinone biosynthesis C-methylase UbiE